MKVKGKSETIKFTVFESHHGMVLDNYAPTFFMGTPGIPTVPGKRIAYAQPGYNYDDQVEKYVLSFVEHAKNVTELLDSANKFQVSSFFIAAADIYGNIGLTVSGRMPLRRKPIDHRRPLDGSKKENDWLGFLPMKYHPRMINPDKGYIAHGNNKVTSENDKCGVGLSGMMIPRADRIV